MPHADEHHRAPLLWLVGPYLAGLACAAAGAGAAGPLTLVPAAGLAAAAILLATRDRRSARAAWLVAIGGAAFLAGMVRMTTTLDERPRWRTLPVREATLDLRVTRVFAPSAGMDRRSCLGRVVAAPEPIDDLIGQRFFFAVKPLKRPDSALLPTMVLRLHGLVSPLDKARISPGSFDDYLYSTGTRFRLDRAAVAQVLAPPHFLPRCWHALDHRFETILRHGLPPDHPATAAYIAMFLGRKSELSDEQKEGYQRSGTMHLFAISGLHIAVLAGCLEAALLALRMPPRCRAVLALVLLWVFVEATGGSPSARRAWLMVAFFWSAQILRRPSNPVAALVGSAAAVLVWQPLALLSASFQLSYAVVAMLLLYGLPLDRVWESAWNPDRHLPPSEWRWWHHARLAIGRNLLAGVAISLAATIASTPLAIGLFGRATPGAVLANLVVVPVTGLAMAAGFASLVCGLCGAIALSSVFNHAAALILLMVDAAVQWGARLPGMSFDAGFRAPWMAPVLLGAVLIAGLAGYAVGWRRFPGRWWTPPGVLAAGLLFMLTPPKASEKSPVMKSAYELAMERLNKSDPQDAPKLSDEQKARLAEIDRVYQGRIAEREIFLQQRLVEAQSNGELEEAEKIRQQIASERARLEEEREDEKNRVRRGAQPSS